MVNEHWLTVAMAPLCCERTGAQRGTGSVGAGYSLGLSIDGRGAAAAAVTLLREEAAHLGSVLAPEKNVQV